MKAPLLVLLGAEVQPFLKSPHFVFGCSQSMLAHDNHLPCFRSFPAWEQPGSLGSAGVTPLHGYYGPLRLLPRPASDFGFGLIRRGLRAAPAAGTGLPSCACDLSRRAVPPTPPQSPGIEARCMAVGISAFAICPKARPAD